MPLEAGAMAKPGNKTAECLESASGLIGTLRSRRIGGREPIALPPQIITSNRGLHDSLRPLSNDDLLIGTEVVRLVRFVNNPETIFARVNVLVHLNLVPTSVDITFDLSLLERQVSK